MYIYMYIHIYVFTHIICNSSPPSLYPACNLRVYMSAAVAEATVHIYGTRRHSRGTKLERVLWVSVLQCVAVCCTVLQCVAVCCTVLQCVAVCCTVLQCVAVCCGVLHYVRPMYTVYIGLLSHCVVVCYSALQCSAVFCRVLQSSTMCCSVRGSLVAMCCSVLYCVKGPGGAAEAQNWRGTWARFLRCAAHADSPAPAARPRRCAGSCFCPALVRAPICMYMNMYMYMYKYIYIYTQLYIYIYI